MSRVVIAGRWDGGIPASPTGDALAAIARGVLTGAPSSTVVTLPVGTGPTFDEAVAALHGVCVAETLGMQRTVIVEGGHNASPDCGIGFLEGLLGDSCIDPRRPEVLADALTRAQGLVADAGVDLVCAASTARPLLGLDSVLAVAPDLEPLENQDIALTAALTQAFAHRPLGRRQLLEGQDVHPARLRGSGAGGGVGAVVAAIGGRIISTGDLLSQLLDLDDIMEGCDLVIVAEPELSSPLLAESTLDRVTSAAAAHALPVVAITRRSSLSHFEKAEWGLHGVFETEGSVMLEDAGRRIARTWLR
ncbi:MAG: glycerate kinase [Actinomyces sp.]|nr:glycerate kinase [Actinomyces sp.]